MLLTLKGVGFLSLLQQASSTSHGEFSKQHVLETSPSIDRLSLRSFLFLTDSVGE
jgi:hypothetical protein